MISVVCLLCCTMLYDIYYTIYYTLYYTYFVRFYISCGADSAARSRATRRAPWPVNRSSIGALPAIRGGFAVVRPPLATGRFFSSPYL